MLLRDLPIPQGRLSRSDQLNVTVVQAFALGVGAVGRPKDEEAKE